MTWMCAQDELSPNLSSYRLAMFEILKIRWTIRFPIVRSYCISFVVMFSYNTKSGRVNVFFKVRKSQIGLYPQSQIHKFLRYASLQISNPKFFFINPKIANPQIS